MGRVYLACVLVAICFAEVLVATAMDPHGPFTPGVHCAAHHGTMQGGPVCCGQPNRLDSILNACPAYAPICEGYVLNQHWGMCAPLAGLLPPRNGGPLSGLFHSAGLFLHAGSSTPAAPQYGFSQPECKYTDPSGHEYDFSGLVKTAGDYKGSDITYNYVLNMCSPANVGGPCADHHGSICQYSKANGNFVATLGSWTQSPYPMWSLIDANYPDKGVQLVFKNGYICWINHLQVTRTAYVQLECDENSSGGDTFYISENYSTCAFTIKLRTPLACRSASAGIFSIRNLLVYFFLVCVYVGGGIYYNHTYNEMELGVEAIPQYEFWKTVPSLVTAYVTEWSLWCYAKAQELYSKAMGSKVDAKAEDEKKKVGEDAEKQALRDDDDSDLYHDAPESH